jgi:L-iditol 2-dehydrogenase
MKAMVLTGLNQMEMRKIPEPQLSSGHDVMIRMGAVGVCGSDIHYYTEGKIGKKVVHYPFGVGHEGAGTVVDVGKEVKRVKPGDRVAIDPAISCGTCDQCLVGRPHTCRNLAFLGCPGQAEGCLCEFIVIPESCLYPIPESMNLGLAALSEPLSIGLYAAEMSIPLKGAKVGILGAGPIGISVLLPALTMGAGDVYVTDKIDDRVNLAMQFGASWSGNPLKTDVVSEILDREPAMLDVVFESCGQQEAMDQAVELLKPGGKLMIIGIPSFDTWKFPVDLLRHKELSIQNVRRQVHRVEKTLAMISEGVIHPEAMITHEFPFPETKNAFDLVSSYADGVLKAMIYFD